jgi:nicotinamide-nucleotide amidase
MKAEIIASGTELLLGEVTDSNTAYIANQLAILGIDLFYASIVGDNFERFSGVLKLARERSDIVIITGGLGPTKGDITREVIAGLLGEKMVVDPELKQHIARFFTRLGMEMPENNLKQATLIPSAISIPNPQGTAPGWWIESGGKIIVSLPGPPGEMQSIWQKEVFPRLEKMGQAVILSRTLKTWGLSESRIDQIVGPFMSLSNPTLALYAKPDGIQLRITAKANTKKEAEALIQVRELELRKLLKDYIWGADNDTLESIISRLLIDKSLTLAVAESFTGGFLSYTLSSLPESSRFFKGGLILSDWDNREKLKITPEENRKADSRSAENMSELTRKQFAADIGIGVDGYIDTSCEPIEGEAYIALCTNEGNTKIVNNYPWRPSQLVRRSVIQALFMLRKMLLEL